MVDRRTLILDGALRVLGEHGMRGLTHRAVDTEAGIPDGSTSYYFRTRAALVTGCIGRLVEIDLALESPAVEATGVDALAAHVTAICLHLAATLRRHTLARYELSLAATRDPALRAVLVEGGSAVRRRLADLLAAVGAADPHAAADEIAAAADGLLLTALVRGPHDPAALAAWLRPAIRRLLLAQPGVPDPLPTGVLVGPEARRRRASR